MVVLYTWDIQTLCHYDMVYDIGALLLQKQGKNHLNGG
jgi:hypothetical protein